MSLREYFKNKAEQKRLRNDWKVVCVLTGTYTYKGSMCSSVSYTLQENALGQRNCISRESGSDSAEDHSIYTHKVFPWLQGATYKDIPSYADIVSREQVKDEQPMDNKVDTELVKIPESEIEPLKPEVDLPEKSPIILLR